METEENSSINFENPMVIIPQLEKTNSILEALERKKTNSIILQNDKAIQIEYVNTPCYLDYMVAFGTIGTVLVSLWLAFRSDRDKRKEFCNLKKFDIISDEMKIDIIGQNKEIKKTLTLYSDYIHLTVFNKCSFTNLEIKSVDINFFNFYDKHLFSREVNNVVNIYSENDIIANFCIKYKKNQCKSNLQDFFSLAQRYAIDKNYNLKLSRHPSLTINTNFGKFNVYASRTAKKILQNAYQRFLESNLTPHSK